MKKAKSIFKGILIYFAGFLTPIILVVLLALITSSNEDRLRDGLTIFPEKGKIINETQFKVIQVLEPNLAIASGKGSGTSVFIGITVLLMRDEGKYFYDGEVIELSSNPNQAGSFQYESQSGRRTVPVIRIK